MAIEFVTAGTISLKQGGIESFINNGEVFILKKRTSHTYTVPEGMTAEKIYIGLEGTLADRMLHTLPPCVIPRACSPPSFGSRG